MEKSQETHPPKGDGDFVSDKINFKIEEENDGIPNHSLESVAFKIEQEDRKAAGSGDEQAEVREASYSCKPPGKCFPADHEDGYGALFSQYSSTLYDVAMEAVTQSLLSSRSVSSRKKSPAWRHFVISPRDSTKAVCVYCRKEFSRGKNEKDLSTSCLMRHVRRAHPTALLPEEGGVSALASLSSPALVFPPQPIPLGDLGTARSPIKLVHKIASSVSSSEQVAEESGSALSSEEVSSDVSTSEKYRQEEALVEPPQALPTPQRDDSAESGPEKSLPLPKSTSGSRRWSAVWKHFYLSPLDSSKAVCIHCMSEFSRGKNGKDLGTSCLIRHMWRAHRAIVLQEKSRGASMPPPYSTPPTLLPALLPPESDPSLVSSSPGSEVQELPSASSSPDQLTEHLQEQWQAGGHQEEPPLCLKSPPVLVTKADHRKNEGLAPVVVTSPLAVMSEAPETRCPHS